MEILVRNLDGATFHIAPSLFNVHNLLAPASFAVQSYRPLNVLNSK